MIGMSELTGVRVRPLDRLGFYDAGGLELLPGDRVVVRRDDGECVEGVVAIAPQQVLHSDLRGPLNPVVRKVCAGG